MLFFQAFFSHNQTFNINISNQEEGVHGNDLVYVDFGQSRKVCERHFNFYGNHYASDFKFQDTDGEKNFLSMTWNGVDALPGDGLYLESNDRYSYGHFSASFKNPNSESQPNAGIVSSLFLYFEPPVTQNPGNRIHDLSEIDFEFLAAGPTEIQMTAHIGYTDESNYERSYRILDLEKGTQLQCQHKIVDQGKKTVIDLEDQPEVPKINGYRNTDWHTYGIDYFKRKLVYWIEINGKKRPLFELHDQYVPRYPMYIMGNIWWTDGWTPFDKPEATEKPIKPVLQYEWIKWEPCTEEENRLYNSDASDTSDEGGTTSKEPETTSEKKEPNSNSALVIGIVVPIVVLVLIGSVIAVILVMRKRRSGENELVTF